MNNPPASPKRPGILFILSAPSGAGKTTLRTMLQRTPDFVYSISCTTRQPRPGEEHGKDYFFLQKEDFDRRVQNGDFLEHATVFNNSYGTLRETVLDSLDRGVDVLLDIDIQGAELVRATTHEKIRAAIADVFLMPASMDVLRQRLLKRGTENSEQLAVRLGKAETEMKARDKYRYNIISGTPEDDFQNFRAIMLAERQLSRRLLSD
ncbi:MAG TPA: guanylate kinase [Chthoniobacteraceae bacterium]|nr:guanylate kinase [Chthoniobacteraceae bacterium]